MHLGDLSQRSTAQNLSQRSGYSVVKESPVTRRGLMVITHGHEGAVCLVTSVQLRSFCHSLSLSEKRG